MNPQVVGVAGGAHSGWKAARRMGRGTVPVRLHPYLFTRGSLTALLTERLGGFKVHKLYQGLRTVYPDEAALLGTRPGRKVRTRDVVLWAGGQPRVVAHSVVRWAGPRCDWPFWKQLGSRSLGSVLFRDKAVRRSGLEVRRVDGRHPLHRLVSASGVQGSEVPGIKARMGMNPLFARRVRYQRRGGATPLVVTEVFLPSLFL